MYGLNPCVIETKAPPIPLAGKWGQLYTPTDGKPLLNLAQGVPGTPPPAEFLQKLSEATLDPAMATYGDLRGDAELRNALAKDINSRYETNPAYAVDPDDISITAGCNLAFYSALFCLAQAGDEVILPKPWYFNNEMVLTQLNLEIVPLECRPPSFTPLAADCEKLITKKTKAIVLVTPNNPTGAIYSPAVLKEFAKVAIKHQVPIIVDETYRDFLESKPHDLFSDPELGDWRKYLIHLYSFSKSYAIPGYRLGALVGSKELQAQVHKTLDCLQICPVRAGQRVVTWAIDSTREWREKIRLDLDARAVFFTKIMQSVPGWNIDSLGAYYAYMRHPYKGVSSSAVAEALASKVGVVTLPGLFFNPQFKHDEDDRFLRFSIANVTQEILAQVPDRLVWLNSLSKDLWPGIELSLD